MDRRLKLQALARHTDIAVDDYVFLRPTQSEAVLLQFGDLCMTRGGKHIGNWAVLRNDGYPAEAG